MASEILDELTDMWADEYQHDPEHPSETCVVCGQQLSSLAVRVGAGYGSGDPAYQRFAHKWCYDQVEVGAQAATRAGGVCLCDQPSELEPLCAVCRLCTYAALKAMGDRALRARELKMAKTRE